MRHAMWQPAGTGDARLDELLVRLSKVNKELLALKRDMETMNATLYERVKQLEGDRPNA